MSRLARFRELPRNVWAASAGSFLTDASSEMILNLLPLFLANVLGAGTVAIGVIEGVAETTASLVKALSGWASDRLGQRKNLAVLGYALSAAGKPLFLGAGHWGIAAAARWSDRLGKGLRTAPRDALLADSLRPDQRGLAFGLHRAADTAGAALGIGVALVVVWLLQGGEAKLEANTFRWVVGLSLIPAFLAVLVLAVGLREPDKPWARERVPLRLRGLGRPFFLFMLLVGLFELGNSADAFLLLRAQERGLSVLQVLAMVLAFNLVYALVSLPGGALSDRVGRKPLLLASWLTYALVYLGFAVAHSGAQVAGLYVLYGVYYGLGYGTQRALVADLVPEHLRGTAYGAYNAAVGLMAFPASLLAGALWQGMGAWPGFGPSAPFFCGAGLALAASLLLLFWRGPRA